MGIIFQDGIIGAQQLDWDPMGKSVRQHLVVLDDENIGCMWITRYMVIEHFLESNQVVGQNFIGGIERNRLSDILGLSA